MPWLHNLGGRSRHHAIVDQRKCPREVPPLLATDVQHQLLLDGIASSSSDQAHYAPAESLHIMLLAETHSDGLMIIVQSRDNIAEAVQGAYGLHSAGRLTVALLGGNEVDARALRRTELKMGRGLRCAG
jgi:hypothetical protein